MTEEAEVKQRTDASEEKPAGRPTRADGRLTRKRILDAARRIIVEEGTDRLTVANVCETAGVSRGNYLYHFRERSGLIEALAEEYACHLNEVQNTEMRVDEQAHAHNPYLAGYENWYRKFSAGEIDEGKSPLLPLVIASRENRKYMAPVAKWYREHFDKLKETPEGQALGLLLSFAYDGLFFHHLFGLKEMTAEEREALLTLMHEIAQGGITMTRHK